MNQIIPATQHHANQSPMRAYTVCTRRIGTCTIMGGVPLSDDALIARTRP
jgi:hypothetical protein